MPGRRRASSELLRAARLVDDAEAIENPRRLSRRARNIFVGGMMTRFGLFQPLHGGRRRRR
jgi:hypothetical protein